MVPPIIKESFPQSVLLLMRGYKSRTRRALQVIHQTYGFDVSYQICVSQGNSPLGSFEMFDESTPYAILAFHFVAGSLIVATLGKV